MMKKYETSMICSTMRLLLRTSIIVKILFLLLPEIQCRSSFQKRVFSRKTPNSALDYGQGGNITEHEFEEPKNNHSNIGKAFIFHVHTGCTASLISKDWALTAAHCFLDDLHLLAVPNEDNDLVYDTRDHGEFIKGTKNEGLSISSSPWTLPIIANLTLDGDFFCTIDKVIFHRSYPRQVKQLWKGNDLALLRLAGFGKQYVQLVSQKALNVVPICLPTQKFAQEFDFGSNAGTVAGYGKRAAAFCTTDMTGPDSFGICGFPASCNIASTNVRECGLDFMYQGKRHKTCLKTKPPSSFHPMCEKLSSQIGGQIKKVTHIFWNGKFVVTCYPENNEFGWCTTRRMGSFFDEEPTFNQGWGFCSPSALKQNCNAIVDLEARDTSDMTVHFLNKEYCTKALLDNIRVEQPYLAYMYGFQPPIANSSVICVGLNHSLELERNDDFFQLVAGSDRSFVKMDFPKNDVEELAKLRPHRIDGGPLCFGDSGGPLWVYDERKTPVLMGFFSFMPWGTCRGAQEPSYYNNVAKYLDWIFQYVPEEHVCKV